MARVTTEVVDGRVRYDGRTLADWAPEVAADVVAACDPLNVILFGSVARGDDGPDSDIDLLVVLDQAPPSERTGIASELRGAVSTRVPVELHVTDQRDFRHRRHVVGAIEEAAFHEGEVLYGQPLERERSMPDPKAQAQEAHHWLTRAQEDLDAAEFLAANAELPPRVACFHAQQAAEKAFRAALMRDAIRFRKTHDLQRLAEALPARWSLRNLDVDFAWLSRWALTARYPGTGLDAAAHDATVATSAARTIVAAVAADLEGIA